MQPQKWFIWCLVLLLALCATALATHPEEKVESLPPPPPSASSEEFYSDDGLEAFDYDAFDESEIDSPSKPEYMPSGPPPPYPPPPAEGQYPVPPPPVYSQPPPPPVYSQPPPPPPPPPQPIYQQPAYTPPPVVEYLPPPPAPVVEYQPPPPPVIYAPPPVSNYSIPIAVTYQTYTSPVTPISYQPPVYSPPQDVVIPIVPAYAPPAPQPHVQPEYSVAPVVSNYTAPTPVSYSPPPPPPPPPQPQYKVATPVYKTTVVSVPVKANYTPPVTYKPVQAQQQYAPAALAHKYSMAELVPFVSPLGYRSNHWSLFYYRASSGRQCSKNMYVNGPSQKDIETAFVYALGQLGHYKGNNIQYMNHTAPSFAARHQIFSYLSQKNARMDEEGLLVELVSQYLADRICLSKWDKQRYLPQLTKFISSNQFPGTHSCSNYYANNWQQKGQQCYSAKYRTYDGFCNNPQHPYWGKSNVCHIRLLSPDYADGISQPRGSYNGRYPLPNPRAISNYLHNDIPLESPYNLMKMQWGQFINHDITNTALSSYDGLVDCCKQPHVRGCWPIWIPPGDRFYSAYNVTCLNFIRSGVCPLCELGPRQQLNKNTAFLDASHVYGNTPEQAKTLRAFQGGQLRVSLGKNNEVLLPISTQDQCQGSCFLAGDSRVNQHPALTVLHTLLLRNHNRHAAALARRHPNWNDETLFQEARRINIAEYQMITYNEYLPIVFGPILSAYYHLLPLHQGNTYFDYRVDPTTWNEYSTATCRFGHSQIQSTFGLYAQIAAYGQQNRTMDSFRLKDWFMRPSLLSEGKIPLIVNGLIGRPAAAVDPWITNDVRNHLYQSHREHTGGDLAATNIWRGRDHGLPAYVHYVEYCFNYKVRGWKDLTLFIPPFALNQLRKIYKVVENVDLFSGGMSERHFPGADIGPTFACVNGIQYYHLKFGDRYYFEHANQPGSFTPAQLDEIRRSTLARLICHTANVPASSQYAFLQPSNFNPLVSCSQLGDIDYNKF